MNRYSSPIPRAALGFAAATLAAMTLGLSVIAPAKMESGNPETLSLAAPQAATPTPTEVAVGPMRIQVVAVREPALATQVRHLQPAQPKRRQQS
jgi:hypothetical protein